MKKTTLRTIAGLTVAVFWQLATAVAGGWNSETRLALAASSSGRIVLHVVCAWRDHRFQWHWQGVVRECAKV